MKEMFGKFIQKNNDANSKIKPMLALSVSAGVIKATVWELVDQSVEILGLGVKVYSDSGKEKDINYKELVEKAADAIDLACQVAETDVTKTIFGFPQSWIVENELLPEFDEIITKLAKQLDLEAVAYVSIPHAISYYLQYLHKTVPTAILVGSSREGATISYVESGKIKETVYTTWSGGNFGKNIDLGLLKFKTLSQFPPLICLYGFGDLDSAKSDLTKYNWSASDRLGVAQHAPEFLTSPKVMVLEEHVDSLAVSLVGGKDLAKHQGIQGRLDIKSLEYQNFNSDALVPIAASASVASVVPNISAGEELASKNALPFGFTTHEPQEVVTSPLNSDTNIENGSTVLPVSDNPYHEDLEPSIYDSQVDGVDSFEDDQVVNEAENENSPWAKQDDIVKEKFINQKRGVRNLKRLAFPILVAIMLFFAGSSAAAWAYWNLPKATVTVFVKPENLDKQISLVAKEQALLSSTENTIPARKITKDIKSNIIVDTTGKSAKGTSSSGNVTVYNKTDSPKTFPSGTEIRTSDNKKFILSENVTIASASADISGKVNGKSTVK
ncbi:MAG: hypothetical protein M3P33_00270, partial [bacterium]|nr:hypothetical protein [bacterium]